MTTNNTSTPTKKYTASENNSNLAIPSQNQKKNDKKYYILTVIFLIMILGEIGSLFLFPSSSRIKNNNQQENAINSNSQSAYLQNPPLGTPISGIGIANGFTITVKKVIKNPTVKGDSPNKPFEYIEFDVSVTNNTNKTTLIPGMFYFQDSSTGMLFTPADMFGYFPDSSVAPFNSQKKVTLKGTNLSFIFGIQSGQTVISSFSQKKVTIANKQPLYTKELQPGQTISNLYLIYQTLPGEKGKLVWDDSYIVTEIQPGKKPNISNLISQTQPGGIEKLVEYTIYDSAHNNKITVFSIE